jgi:hypothetical protein
MTESTMLTLLAAGGLGYIALNDGGGPSVPGTPTPTSGTDTKPFNRAIGRLAAGKAGTTTSSNRWESWRLARKGSTTEVGTGGKSASGLPQDVEDRIKQDMKRYWEAMSGEAKVKACQALKKQFPNDAAVQAYDCSKAASASFQTVLTLTAAATGMALCGPPCSTVGILAVALAGPKLQEWAESAWSEVEEVGQQVGSAVEEWWDSFF